MNEILPEDESYCPCLTEIPDDGMIFCDACRTWLHFRCIGCQTSEMAASIQQLDTFICPFCLRARGRVSTMTPVVPPPAHLTGRPRARQAIRKAMPLALSAASLPSLLPGTAGVAAPQTSAAQSSFATPNPLPIAGAPSVPVLFHSVPNAATTPDVEELAALGLALIPSAAVHSPTPDPLDWNAFPSSTIRAAIPLIAAAQATLAVSALHSARAQLAAHHHDRTTLCPHPHPSVKAEPGSFSSTAVPQPKISAIDLSMDPKQECEEMDGTGGCGASSAEPRSSSSSQSHPCDQLRNQLSGVEHSALSVGLCRIQSSAGSQNGKGPTYACAEDLPLPPIDPCECSAHLRRLARGIDDMSTRFAEDSRAWCLVVHHYLASFS
jgi:hypothetical protein